MASWGLAERSTCVVVRIGSKSVAVHQGQLLRRPQAGRAGAPEGVQELRRGGWQVHDDVVERRPHSLACQCSSSARSHWQQLPPWQHATAHQPVAGLLLQPWGQPEQAWRMNFRPSMQKARALAATLLRWMFLTR